MLRNGNRIDKKWTGEGAGMGRSSREGKREAIEGEIIGKSS